MARKWPRQIEVGPPREDASGFWKDRLVHRSYADRDGRAVEMPGWHVGIVSRGRREWFKLTANQAAAAVKTREELRGKAKRAKYDYVNGGHKAWLANSGAKKWPRNGSDKFTGDFENRASPCGKWLPG